MDPRMGFRFPPRCRGGVCHGSALLLLFLRRKAAAFRREELTSDDPSIDTSSPKGGVALGFQRDQGYNTNATHPMLRVVRCFPFMEPIKLVLVRRTAFGSQRIGVCIVAHSISMEGEVCRQPAALDASDRYYADRVPSLRVGRMSSSSR